MIKQLQLPPQVAPAVESRASRSLELGATTALRVLRRPAMRTKLGLGDTQIDEAVRRGELPPPIALTESGRAIGWIEAEIDAHLAARMAARDQAMAAGHSRQPEWLKRSEAEQRHRKLHARESLDERPTREKYKLECRAVPSLHRPAPRRRATRDRPPPKRVQTQINNG